VLSRGKEFVDTAVSKDTAFPFIRRGCLFGEGLSISSGILWI